MKNTLLSLFALVTLVVPQIPAHGRTLTVLYSFSGRRDGGNPRSNLLRDSSGNVYGTTVAGGTSGNGTVFRIDGSGKVTVVHTFSGGSDGASPQAGLIADSAGNIYGTTSAGGGTSNAGTVFKITRTGSESILHSFTGGQQDGAAPQAALLLISGMLYGTTAQGGLSGAGTVFQVDATTGSESVLYNFAGGADGANPHARLITDGNGNLYGTTSSGGGASNAGTVFEITITGTYKPLYSFTGGMDGADPEAELVLDRSNNLYGTTNLGGTDSMGTVFKLDANRLETVIHSFSGGTDGKYPQAGLVLNSNGILYGTTTSGGIVQATTARGAIPGSGTVFRLTTAGAEAVVYTFSGSADGGAPSATLIQGAAGIFYGTASQGGGPAGAGTIFKLNAFAEKVLHSFGSTQNDGQVPSSRLIADSAGNLYGTTETGGTDNQGTVYGINPSGQERVLYSFLLNGIDGVGPLGGVVRDQFGNLYGTTSAGGAYGGGTVYKVDPTGHETVLHNFPDPAQPNDGKNPEYVDLVFDSAGNLYGTTEFGGTNDLGTVFKITAAGAESVIHNFAGGTSDGAVPFAGVIVDNSSGILYGTTCEGGLFNGGTVFKVDTNGNETPLHSFDFQNDGYCPFATVTLDHGNLYGTADGGGPYSGGTVFRLDLQGTTFTVLHSFPSFTGDGFGPFGGVVFDGLGNIYGTTAGGGGIFGSNCLSSTGCGTVFVLDTAFQESLIHTFTGGADGGTPFSGLLLLNGASPYGTTAVGGSGDSKYGCCRGVSFNLVAQ